MDQKDVIFGNNDYHVIATNILDDNNLSRKSKINVRQAVGMSKLDTFADGIDALNGVQNGIITRMDVYKRYGMYIKSHGMSVGGFGSNLVSRFFGQATKINQRSRRDDKELKEE